MDRPGGRDVDGPEGGEVTDALAATREKEPKPPRIAPLIAVALELAMLGTFAVDRSIVGLLLALAYSYFSATWAMLAGSIRS